MAEAKPDGAFRTIGELAAELGLPQHILRYWETRFPQLRPLTRAGKRRYYRPDDVVMVRRINDALNRDGYTIKGVQQLLGARQTGNASPSSPSSIATPAGEGVPLSRLIAIRDTLKAALAAS